MVISRWGFILQAACLVSGYFGLTPSPREALVADSAPTNIQATPRVQTTLGPVEGRLDGEVSAFTGVPYAESPVGTRRFRAPEPKRPWTSVFDATKPGPLCPQVRMSGQVAGSEDCLTVNVWSPPNAKGLPVMVFLHGGRHMVGGALGGQISFDGARLAEEARVVVFSVEFRFGLLGYLTHPALDGDADSGRSGNYGMRDQLLGLQWVRENARAFGGEAERVTVFGQSSGSTDIALLLAAPRARGLFHRAILDSVPLGAAVASRARALEVGQKAAQAAGCSGPDAASCLRTVSTERLLKSAANADLVFAPHVDGALFPVAPLEAFDTGAYAHMPILLGTARDEQAYFRPDVSDAESYAAMIREQFPKVAEQALALYPVSKYGTPNAAYIAALSDRTFTCPTRRLARTLSKAQSEPVYRYLFTHAMERGPDAQLGAFHILSQFFLFGRYETYPYEPSDQERGMSKLLQGYWGRFTSGNPNGSGTPKWEPYEPSRDPVMLLDLHPVLATDLRPDECNFWDRSGS
jgi:para-nitrobenzyl esterase